MTKVVYRKLFLTTLLSSTVAFSLPSYADDNGTYFYPKNKWTVTTAATQGDTPVCTISNQLNNGYILQFAGAESGLKNLNIDFRQSTFKKDQPYTVKYTIPGQEVQSIPTKAYKENVLVSDLREHKDFSEKLFDASTMDIDIHGNKFRVYLTGLKANLQDFNECTDPGGKIAMAKEAEEKQKTMLSGEPAVQDGIAPPPPVNLEATKSAAQVAAPILDEKQKRPDFYARERYSDEMARQLKEESDKYKPADPTQEHPQSQQTMEAIKITDVEREINDTAPQETIIGETQQEPVQEIESAPAVEISAQNVDVHKETAYDDAIKEVQETVQRKDAIYHIAKPSKPIVADLTHLDEKQETQDEQTSKVNDAPTITDEEIVADTNAANMADEQAQEANNYEPASAQNNEDFVIMRNKILSLESQLEAMKSKNEILDAELKETLKDSQKERLSVASKNWNLEKATMKFNEAERQVMRLGRQLQTIRAQCDQEKEELEAMLFDPKLTHQQQLAKLASLEAELDETKSELYRQQRQYEERIRLLEGRLNAQ